MKRSSLGSLVALAAASMLIAGPAFAQDDPPPPPEPAPEPEPAPPEPPPAETPPPAPEPAPAPPPAAAPITFGASTAPQADTGKKPAPPPAAAKKPEKLAWRNTLFLWDNSASSETIGLGRDVQSSNPSYETAFSLRPRYYVYTDDDQSVSLRADVGVFAELTNSDSTTKRNEWSWSDAQLLAAYVRTLIKDGDYKTDLSLKAPILGFPTSKISANNGRYLSLGASAGVAQDVPLAGSKSEVFQTVTFNATAGYSHWFTRATSATNSDLNRVRMDPEGRSVPGDQISSAAFAEHQATFSIGADLAIHDRVTWTNNFSWRPSWKYSFNDNVNVCNNVTTGCVQPDRVNDPQTFSVVTLFESEIGVKVIDELDLSVGYNNLTLQLGPDGQRRNVFYSPDSRFYITATAHLDTIYQAATGTKQTAKAPSTRQVAKR